MNRIDSAVRPAITVALVITQIALSILWAYGTPHAEQAFAAVGSFTMMAVTFWFKSRDDEKARG